MEKLTEEQWLARCRTVYRMGLARPEILGLLERAFDAVMRLEHSIAADSNVAYIAESALEQALKQENPHVSQMRHVSWFVEREQARYAEGAKHFTNGALPTLANDEVGYAVIRLLAVLNNPCQGCASSTKAWHTRACMGHHEEEKP